MSKVPRYAKAVARWIKAGRPVRPRDEVARIYDTICQPCEYFNGKNCKICGCRVARDGLALRNKLALGSEHCPKKKW